MTEKTVEITRKITVTLPEDEAAKALRTAAGAPDFAEVDFNNDLYLGSITVTWTETEQKP